MKLMLILVVCSSFALLNCENIKDADSVQDNSSYQNLKPKEAYPDLIKRVNTMRDSLQKLYLQADELQKPKIIEKARNYVFASITEDYFPQWFGTEWDFNGTTTTPREGKVACGYFVTTVLRDAGFNIPRIKWAQAASEVFIQKISKDIKRFSNRPIEDIIAYIEQKDDGLYIVGMDSHVGFIFKHKKILQFVHSSYYQPKKGVMSQDLNSENPLNDSKYRVIGRILDDDVMVKWILNEAME